MKRVLTTPEPAPIPPAVMEVELEGITLSKSGAAMGAPELVLGVSFVKGSDHISLSTLFADLPPALKTRARDLVQGVFAYLEQRGAIGPGTDEVS